MGTLGLAVWRFAIAALGFVGVWMGVSADASSWRELGVVSAALVGVGFFAMAVWPLLNGGRSEPRSPWLRGALTVDMIVVALTWSYVMHGSYHARDSLVLHLVLPAVVVFDYFAMGSNQRRAHVWFPLSWVVIPAAYFAAIYFTATWPYEFLSPGLTTFWPTISFYTVCVVFFGFLLYGYGLVRRAMKVEAHEVVYAHGRERLHG